MKKVICSLIATVLSINQIFISTFAGSNCKVSGCDIPIYADGYCVKHYQDSRCIEKNCINEKKIGDYCEKHYNENMICKFEGCKNEIFKDSYCEFHYKGKALTDVAIDYTLGLIPFGIGGLAKSTINILAEKNDIKKVYNDYQKKAEKKYDIIKFGKLPSAYDDEIKDIEWYVIDENNDEKLLLSKGNYVGLPYIDTTGNPYMTQKEYDDLWYSTIKEDEYKIQEYDKKIDELIYNDIKYKDSFIRFYLNDNFYKEAFNDEEKNKICEHKINTIHFNSENKFDYLEETTDKLYPIGMNEMNMYFENNTELLYNEGRTDCDKFAETQSMQIYLRDVGLETVFDKKYQSPYYACFNFINTSNGAFNIKKNPYVGKRFETRILMWIKK